MPRSTMRSVSWRREPSGMLLEERIAENVLELVEVILGLAKPFGILACHLPKKPVR
jgi:hypothetical protein